MWESWVQSLGGEDSPGEGKGYALQHSSLGPKELDTTESLSLYLMRYHLQHLIISLQGISFFY